MLAAIPLTVIPLILFNVIGFAVGGEPWNNVLFGLPLISGKAWSVTVADVMIVLALILLFFEILRSANPSRGATVANHIVSTVVLLVYVIEFITTAAAANSLFFVLMAIALFDVVAGFTISIRTAQRDFSIGHGGGIDSPI
jgi:hypothetical protein